MTVTSGKLTTDVGIVLRRAAEPIAAGEGVEVQIRRAARRCHLTYSRARRLWYGEARVSGLDLVNIFQAARDKRGTVLERLQMSLEGPVGDMEILTLFRLLPIDEQDALLAFLRARMKHQST